jgi:hypothetical protein
MEWSGQQGALPQQPQNAQQPAAGQIPAGGYYGAGPQQQMPANPLNQPGLANNGGFGQPMPQAPGVSMGMPGAPSGVQAGIQPVSQAVASNAPQLDDNISDVNDQEWVNRAKRAIGSTRGDPHRQVQLIQHLRSQYLKQRFGRTVHTDKA